MNLTENEILERFREYIFGIKNLTKYCEKINLLDCQIINIYFDSFVNILSKELEIAKQNKLEFYYYLNNILPNY